MRLTGRDLLDGFGQRHPKAKKALDSWIQAMEKTQFEHFMDLKKAFPYASYVPPFTVFNVCGNNYRLAAIMNYKDGLVFVKAAMTHEEYNRGRWRTL